MSKIEVNAVEPQCGTTLTLGASGDTVTLGSGASQSGFGRTGTVNWVTTKKTTSFTAVSGEGYFCDTAASGAFTLTLPSSPSAGDIVGFKDYNGNFEAANLTIGRGGSPINGANSADPVISTAGASIFLVYVDASQGWVATQDDESVFSGDNFITATGGTITTCGNFKIHTFTGPGTFTVCSASSSAGNNIVDYLVVAGGGGGGAGCGGGGGGGAGGFRFFANTTNNPQSGKPGAPRNGYGTPSPSGTAITVSATGYPITVGGGGAGGTVTGPSSELVVKMVILQFFQLLPLQQVVVQVVEILVQVLQVVLEDLVEEMLEIIIPVELETHLQLLLLKVVMVVEMHQVLLLMQQVEVELWLLEQMQPQQMVVMVEQVEV